jgi:hypothetical protein
MLKWIIGKWGWKVLIGFIWLRIVTGWRWGALVNTVMNLRVS